MKSQFCNSVCGSNHKLTLRGLKNPNTYKYESCKMQYHYHVNFVIGRVEEPQNIRIRDFQYYNHQILHFRILWFKVGGGPLNNLGSNGDTRTHSIHTVYIPSHQNLSPRKLWFNQQKDATRFGASGNSNNWVLCDLPLNYFSYVHVHKVGTQIIQIFCQAPVHNNNILNTD